MEVSGRAHTVTTIFADLLARLDETVRIGDVVKDKGAGDRRPERAVGRESSAP